MLDEDICMKSDGKGKCIVPGPSVIHSHGLLSLLDRFVRGGGRHILLFACVTDVVSDPPNPVNERISAEVVGN